MEEREKMDISIPYYEDLSRISNSNIGWFLNKGPSFLHKMLSGEGEELNLPQLKRGTMIHEYLLQPEEFQKDYVVWDKSRPSSAQQEKFCQELSDSTEIEPNKAIISAYKASYAVTNKSDDKILAEGLKIASTLKDYIDFKRSNDQRIMITPYDVKNLQHIKSNVESHKLASILLRHEFSNDNEELYHEFHINWNHTAILDKEKKMVNVPCKSLLDSVHFNFKNQICILMDVKTTANIGTFQDSMNHYDYLRQLCYYIMALEYYISNILCLDLSMWTFKAYILAIEASGDNEVRVFEFDMDKVMSKEIPIVYALNDIAWHFENNKWDHRKEYYLGDGSETLIL